MEVPTLYYDADCGFCSASVRFVAARLGSQVRFAPLLSVEAQEALRRLGLDPEALDTVVLVEDGRAFTRSEAALGVVKRLRWPWRAGAALVVVPHPLRDAVYDFVARHRSRLGTRSCRASSRSS